MGVNLEGMKYDGWPIGRLIDHELRRPTLIDVIQYLPDAGRVDCAGGVTAVRRAFG